MVDSQAIDATDLVVSVRDRTGRYVLVNRGFEELTGLPRDRLQGKRDAALSPQDIAEKVSVHDAQVFDTGAPSEVDEELLGREGRVPVRTCRFAICNDDGEPWAVCAVSASRDRAELVRAERDRLAAIADGTPRPHSAVTSERLDTLVADLATARETASGLTEALEAERNAREEQAEALEAERNAREEQAEALEAERAARAEAEAARAEAEAARAEAEAAQAEAEAEARRQAQQAEGVSARVAAAEDQAGTAEERAAAAEAQAAAAAERAAAAEQRAAEVGEQLQHERAGAAKLSERVKSLEGAKRAAEGGLLQTVRLRHDQKRLASQLETERRSRQDLAVRLEHERKAHAGDEARLDELTRDVERKDHELDAAREAFETARAELETTRAELKATRAELDTARAELETTRTELETTRTELETTRTELETTRTELESRPAASRSPAAAANGGVTVNGDSGAVPGPPTAATAASLVAVQRRVADLISDASSLDGAMRAGLAAFGELAGWDAAVGWLLARDGKWLRPATVWCSQFVAGSTFDIQTWQAILDDGPRALAAAWENAETVWLENAGAEEDRPRCRWARAAGLTSAAAVPIVVDGEPRGMIEVFKRDRSDRDDDVLAVLETIATQLGGIERLLELADRPRWR